MRTNKPIIADSSGLISLLARDDSNHLKALKISKEISQTRAIILIPNEVFIETLNALGKKIDKQTVYKMGKTILLSEIFSILETGSQINMDALDKFLQTPRSVSYTDCLVMAYADEFETKEIFGFDEVFRKKGYLTPGLTKRN